MYKVRYHLLMVAKETFPDLSVRDLHNEMESLQEGTTAFHQPQIVHKHDGEAKLDDIFAELDSTFPSLSISSKATSLDDSAVDSYISASGVNLTLGKASQSANYLHTGDPTRSSTKQSSVKESAATNNKIQN